MWKFWTILSMGSALCGTANAAYLPPAALPLLNAANTWTAGQSFPTIQLPASITLSGSQGATAATTSLFSQGTLAGTTSATNIPFAEFSASAPLTATAGAVETLFSNLSVGASSAAGQYTAVWAQVTQNASTGTKAAGIGQAEFVPIQSFTSASHNEGGTGTTLGLAYGALVGMDLNPSLQSGATNFYTIEGIEMGVTTKAGSSVSHRVGVQIFSNAAVQGTLTDAAIDIGSSAGSDLGFQCGICYGKADNTFWPVSPTGTMIGTYNLQSGTQGSALGIDFSNVTFSTGFLKSTGFLVDGLGNISLKAFTSTMTSYNDPTGSGTVALKTLNTIPSASVTATSAVTYTVLAGLAVSAPTVSTNVTSPSIYAIEAFGGTNTTGSINGSGGLFVNGGLIALNKNNNNVVEIADGTSNGAVTIGGASNKVAIASAGLMIGSATPLTLVLGEVGLPKITASGSAPGAAGIKLAAVCGTAGGSLKIIAYAGTSTTPTTVIDSVGSGVTGC